MVALDISEESFKNLKANRPKIPFLLGDIKGFTTSEILKEAGLKPGEVDVITGPHKSSYLCGITKSSRP